MRETGHFGEVLIVVGLPSHEPNPSYVGETSTSTESTSLSPRVQDSTVMSFLGAQGPSDSFLLLRLLNQDLLRSPREGYL